MKAVGDIGWKKYRKLVRDPARRAYYARSRTLRHSAFLRSLGAAIERTGG